MSVQLPVTVAPARSGPANVSVPQDAIPDVTSVPCQLMPTGWLYQSLKSGSREKTAVTPVGGSASIFRIFVSIVVVPPSLVAEQRSVVPLFGPATGMYCSHGADVMGDSGSLIIQWTTM